MTILKIHGNSGSGKTTIVRNLFDQATTILPHGDAKKPEAYELVIPGINKPIFIIGSYENTCGGVDTIPNAGELRRRVFKYAPLGNVIYEGLLVSTYFGTVGQQMLDAFGDKHVWAFLDTPLEECITRIKARRLAAGNTKPLNETNTRNRHKPIAALREKLIAKGALVLDLQHDRDPTGAVLEELV